MAEFPALPLWTDALLGDTQHLSMELFGAYIMLLIVAWRRPGCDLPDDDYFLANVCKCEVRKWRRTYRPTLAPFHQIEGGTWRQKRLQKERNYVRDNSTRMSALAQRRWNKNNDMTDAHAHAHAYAQRNAPIPNTTSEEDKSSSSVVVRAASPRAARPDVSRGTRWPADAVVSQEWLLLAKCERTAHGLPEINLELEATRFANYWSAKTGAAATKLDWRKTWLNWILDEGKTHGRAKRRTAHDNFLAGVAKAVRETLGPAEEGGDNVIAGTFGRPLLPP